MAASSPVGGYDCELFVGSVPEELKCGLCKKVAREPSLTSCCGEHFCKLCIEKVIQDKKPCPSCGEAEFTTLINKRDHKKIRALKVQCAMKDRGCDWTGTLEQLDAHLDVNSDNCQYVDVKCPNECDQPVQKRHLPTHLAKECTKRDFFCQYCNFKATYEVVCNDHWPQCPFYPIPCPNGCEIMALERGDLDAHLMLCSLEEVECEFSESGCKVTLVREEMEKHLADNLQRHMLMMNKAVQEKMEQKERKIEELEARLEKKTQELQEEKDRQLREVQEKTNRQVQALEARLEEKHRQVQELEKKTQKQVELKDEQMREFRKELEKERQIREKKNQELHETMKQEQQRQQATHAEVARVEEQLKVHVKEYKERVPFLQFALTDFQGMKRRKEIWTSPPMYTHPGGYKIGWYVRPNGKNESTGTHVSVWLGSAKGENDDNLKWPADCTITLQLLNQHRDQDHFTVSKRFHWDKPTITSLRCVAKMDDTFIAHKDLDWNADKQTQYLKNDTLQFRIYSIQVHSV